MLYKIEDTIASPAQSDNTVFVGLASSSEGYKPEATDLLAGFLVGMDVSKSSDNLSSRFLAEQTPHLISHQGDTTALHTLLHQTPTPTYNIPTLSALSSPQQDSKGPFRSSKYEKGPDLVSINYQYLQTKPLLE